MSAINAEAIIKGALALRVGISTVSSSLMTMYAVSVYLFVAALFLFAAVILFLIHWRHEIVKSRRKLVRDNVDSPESLLTSLPYQSRQLSHYEKLQEKPPSMETLENYNRYSQYDNYMPNGYEKDYEAKFTRNTGLV